MRRDTKICLILTIFASFTLFGTAAFSIDDDAYEVSELEDKVLSEGRKSGFKFSSIPLTQVSPAYKTVTYALGVDYIDTTVTPEESIYSTSSTYSQTRKLDIDGYTVAPYLSLSLRNIGIGIAGEIGNRKVSYLDATSVTNAVSYDSDGNRIYNYSYSNFRKEESQLNYTGLGIYLYINLTPSWKKLIVNGTLGVKSLNGKHEAKSFNISSSSGETYDSSTGGATGEWETVKYSVTKSEFGMNARWKVSKRISLIPWVHYVNVNTTQIDDALDRCADSASSTSSYTPGCTITHTNRYYSDVQLFWHDKSPFHSGLDFTAKYGSLEVHLGGVVGGVVNMISASLKDEGESGPVMDDTYTLSVSASYETKAR